VIIGFPATVSP
jgi:hypothetical protein